MAERQGLTRREFLRRAGTLAAGVAGAAALGGCAQPTPQVVEKETIVTKEVEKLVEKVVTATPAPQKTELTFFNWASAEEATRKNIEEMIAKFEGDNPGVTIKNVQYGFGDIQSQVLIAITAGNAPDIAQCSTNMPFELAAMGALEPLNGYMSQAYLADSFQSSLDAGSYDGSVYAVPWTITHHAFWYNKKLMEKLGLDPTKPPKTIDELNAASEKAKAQNVYGMGLDTTKRQYALFHQWPFMLTFNGGEDPLKDNKPNFTSDGLKAYYEWLRFYVKEKLYSPPAPAILREFRQFAAQETEIFAFDGTYYKGIVQSLNEALKDDQVFYDTWAVTGIPTQNSDPLTVFEAHQLEMFKACQNKEMAWKFIEFMTSDPLVCEKYMIPLGAVPPLKSLAEQFKDAYNNPIHNAYINEISPTARPMPFGPKYASAAEFIMPAMQEVVATDKPIDQILERLQENLLIVFPQA
ncbi:MAG: sugar ABC transporter substrate-binding protein [Chloroflexi bacterium]|nr:sugar ABC transporter substrate-binding protein [Chloroflexota bacterium]